MNKQELIEKLKTIDGGYGSRYYIAMGDVFELVEQLDEPQKPVIPQFVADYIDISKFYVRTLHYALENSPEKVKLWLCEDEKNRQEIFARAWLDGYEVEEEKKYKIKIKASGQYLLRDQDEDVIVIGNQRIASRLTKKQIEEAGFGWVFDCPGIEIEEVEE